MQTHKNINMRINIRILIFNAKTKSAMNKISTQSLWVASTASLSSLSVLLFRCDSYPCQWVREWVSG